ncbi:MAG: PIN domain-containing protein [Sumerlaeia bacterium]
MNHAIFDTNVLSYFLNKDTRAENYRVYLAGFEWRIISFVTLLECRFGAERRAWGPVRRAGMESLLTEFQVVYSDDSLCFQVARLLADLERAGTPIGTHDTWIAATALALQCPVVTHNARHFRAVEGLRFLTA